MSPCASDGCERPAEYWAATSFLKPDGERLAMISGEGCCEVHRGEFMWYAHENLDTAETRARLERLGFAGFKIEVHCVTAAEAVAMAEAVYAGRPQ